MGQELYDVQLSNGIKVRVEDDNCITLIITQKIPLAQVDKTIIIELMQKLTDKKKR